MPELEQFPIVFMSKIVKLFGKNGRKVFEAMRSKMNDASDEEHTHEDDTEGGKLRHNNALKDYDGGQAGQYYHLTSAEYAAALLNTIHRSSIGIDHSHVVLNDTHRGSPGTDHGYIDQDVRTVASPAFVKVKTTEIELTIE